MSQKRRSFSANQKVYILRNHLLDKTPVSDICVQYGLHPNVFYRWQKEFFENGGVAFNGKNEQAQVEQQLRKEISLLKQKLQDKNEVVSELMEEYIGLKKRLGEK